MAFGVALLVLPAGAVADPTSPIQISAPAPTRQGQGTDDYLIATRDPTFQISADMSSEPGAVSAQCMFEYQQVPVACDDPHTDGCPASMCWTATGHYANEGAMDRSLTVTLEDADGNDVDSNGIFFAIDTSPPDTTLDPAVDVSNPRRAVFNFSSPQADDTLTNYFPLSYQCSLTAAGANAPGAWSGCTPDGSGFKVSQTARYRFWVRAVDWVGRPDPTPASTVFSQSPCRLAIARRAPRTLQAIARHKLRVRVNCLQPSPILISLSVAPKLARRLHLLSTNFGSVAGYAGPGRLTQTITYRPQGRPSKLLLRQRRLALVLTLSDSGRGSRLPFSVRG